MSIVRDGQTIENLYVGVQKRQIPLPPQKEAKGSVFTVTKDNIEVYGAPVITLTVGNTYNFIIDSPGHPFYITTDFQGAGVARQPQQSLVGAIEIPVENSKSKGNVGIEKGTITWTPKIEHAQMDLYYQCNFHPRMGNEIKVLIPKY